MANTLIPIQTITLTGSTTSVTFSNIPQNYTDLKLVYSARCLESVTGPTTTMSFNGSTSSVRSVWLYGDGGSAPTSANSTSFLLVPSPTNGLETASTFGSAEIYIPNYTSSNYKSYSAEGVDENNASGVSSVNMNLVAGLWSNTSAITSITLSFGYPGTRSFVSGSTFTLYGISNGVKATGGTLTVAGGYAYHTFTSTGSFLPNQQIKGAEILAVAGGGGGGDGGGAAGGGGGAGGVLYASNQTLNAGTSYTALIGSGGATNTKGGNSVFAAQTAQGGGYGGSEAGAAASGGSGGGAHSGYTTGGSGTSGQGNSGGNWISGYPGYGVGSGGGGAGAAGTASAGVTVGNGGDGTYTYTTWHSITGTGVLSGGVYYIGGGGGGGAYNGGTAYNLGPTTGGSGGGGRGAKWYNGSASNGSTAGTANTGGGGGGQSYDTGANKNGAAGGSGLIIVRYPLS